MSSVQVEDYLKDMMMMMMMMMRIVIRTRHMYNVRTNHDDNIGFDH